MLMITERKEEKKWKNGQGNNTGLDERGNSTIEKMESQSASGIQLCDKVTANVREDVGF